MPGRNIYKDYVADSFYHVYNRGTDRQIIFRDDLDYRFFLYLIKRYLGEEAALNSVGIAYPSYRGSAELLAYCLMPRHFHLLLYQHDRKGMMNLLKSLSVAYGMYFNKRYSRIGPVFQQRYRASRITDESYLLHISRYIHLNPDDYKKWTWSSLPYYVGELTADWLKPDRILELFEGEDYSRFVDDYKDRRDDLEIIKHELADQLA